MNKKRDHADPILTLRQQAEEALLHKRINSSAEAAALSAEEMDRTLHNLQVHQIELEMQNEELIRAQIELETLRARYFDLYDLAPVGYVTISEKGLILETNLTAASLLGLARNQLVMQPLTRYILKEDQDIYYLHRKRLFETQEPQACELRMTRSDGVTFWADLVGTVAQSVDGEPICRVAVSDISKRKKAEIETQESHRFLANLLEAIPIPVFYKDQDGRYLGFNKAFEVLFGKGREELIGKTVFDINPPDLARIFMDKDRTLFMQTGQQLYESKIVDANGLERDVIFHKASTHNAEGKVTGLIGAISDITQHKQAERERENMQEQLIQAQKVEAIGRLAGGVAHDFNNMLCIILGYGENLMNALPSGGVLYQDAREIVAAGRRSAELTRQLLAFSRKQILKPVVLNLNMLLTNLDKMLRRLIGEDIDLRLQLADQIHHIMADPGQIEQVVMNLAINARDAMLQGGKLTIETRIAVLDETDVLAYSDIASGSYMLLTISDSGAGMDKETLSHLFEPFFTTKEQGKGTGLGLSTVYGIVKQSGGNIQVDSKAGQGTVFKVFFPAIEGESGGLLWEDPIKMEVGHGEHILVVEDEAALRSLTERTLKELGYRVSLVANGQEAIDFLVDKRVWPDLLISDVIMPGMNGPQLAEQLKQKNPGIRVLFMSGYTDNDVLSREILATGTPYLQKPFNTRDLAAIVAKTLQGNES